MKQHIDSEQLKELDYKQITNLYKLANLHGSRIYGGIPISAEKWDKHKTESEYLTMHTTIMQKYSIGFMMEVLNENDIFSNVDEIIKSGYFNEYICDSLWHEVKTKVLNNME